MNNACPSCGAVYAVTPKDVGRKIKCKKCSTALRVDDTGLIVDAPTASAPPAPPAVPAAPVAAAVVEDDADDDFDRPKKIKKPGRAYSGGPGILTQIGGVPTVLFSVGLILVIWFTFMTPIGEASIVRSATTPLKLMNEQKAELKKLLPKGKRSEFELTGEEKSAYQEKAAKIQEEYAKKLDTAGLDATDSIVSNLRAPYWEKYGQMFGFVLLAFGCLGYLRTEQPPVMHYVAGVILAGMMLAVFSQASGCGGRDGMSDQIRNSIMRELNRDLGGGKGGPGFP